MNALNQLSGFWRLWIALSVLWIAGVYIEGYWWTIGCWFTYCDDSFTFEEAIGWPPPRVLFFRSVIPPIAILALAALARWIVGGFKRDGS